MIKGIGTDCVDIARIARAIAKPAFLNKIFTENERAEYAAKGHNAQTLAGKFAAKEAVAKSLGVGFTGFSPSDIEILAQPAPFVTLYGGAQQRAQHLGIAHVLVSISHEKTIAIAFAVAES